MRNDGTILILTILCRHSFQDFPSQEIRDILLGDRPLHHRASALLALHSTRLSVERSSSRSHLCQSRHCDCTLDVMFCRCKDENINFYFNDESFGSSDEPSINTVQISGCRFVQLGRVERLSSSLRTIIILNTTVTELLPGALSFHRSARTMVFLGSIPNLSIHPGSVGGGISRFYIVSSHIVRVNDGTFTGLLDMEVLDFEDVTFPEFNERLVNQTTYDIFPQNGTMKLLKISNSYLGVIYGNFIKCVAQTVQIDRNVMSIDSEKAFDIESEDVIFEENRIEGRIPGSVRLVVMKSLLLKNNVIEDNNLNILSLIFPNALIESAVVRESQISRVTSNFINCKSRMLEISNCTLHLVEEDIINAEVDTFVFRNNRVRSIETNAINIRSENLVDLSNNIFEHIQPGSIQKIRFAERTDDNSTSLVFRNNSFEGMEDGFLRFNDSLVNNLNNKIDNIYFNTDCSCNLVETAMDVTVRGEDDVHREDEDPDEHDHHLYMEALLRIKEQLQHSVQCNEGGLIIQLDESSSCSDWTVTIILVFVSISIVSLIILTLVVLWLHEKLKEKALKQFIVPPSTTKEGKLELHRAESFTSSLPDLLRSLSGEK